jgi:hypothetical protein
MSKLQELLQHIDDSIVHHEVTLDGWDEEPKDVFKTKNEVKVFLSALYQFKEMLEDAIKSEGQDQ